MNKGAIALQLIAGTGALVTAWNGLVILLSGGALMPPWPVVGWSLLVLGVLSFLALINEIHRDGRQRFRAIMRYLERGWRNDR